MKKNFIKSFGLLLLILATPIFAVPGMPTGDSAYQIYVHNIEADQEEYQVGDKMTGTFSLSNLSTIPQSDIYYSISSGIYRPENLTIEGAYGVTDKVGPLYIKANSKDTIPFSYTLPKSVSGNVGVQVVATLKDGTVVGQSDINVMVDGKAKETSYVINPYLFIGGYDKAILPDTGPTVYSKETVGLGFSIAPTSKKYTVTPVLKLYDRVDNADALKKTIKLDPISTDIIVTGPKSSAVAKHIISLPADLDPLVYYGVLSFESEEVDISSISMRYIIAGPIATIRNITTENLEVKKGEVIKAVLSYGGQPLDEFRPEKQMGASSTMLTVTALNEKNETVGTVSQPLDLNNPSRTVDISIKANVAANSLSFVSTIKDAAGNVLDEYATKLPSVEDVKNQVPYNPQSDMFTLTIVGTFLIVLLLIIIFVIINKKYKISPTAPLSLLIIGFAIALSVFGIKNTVFASGISAEQQDYLDTINGIQNNLLGIIQGWKPVGVNGVTATTTGYFQVTSVSSPLPPWITIYEPGQKFNLTFGATYADCNNQGRHYWAYSYDPSINWQNQEPKLDGTFEDRAAYWDQKGVKLLDWNNGDSWEELFLKSDLKIITQYMGVNNGAGISANRELYLKKLAKTALDIEEYCTAYSDGSGPHPIASCSDRSLRMDLYEFANDGEYSARDFVEWGKLRGARANQVKSILADAGVIPNSLANFDFEATSNLKLQDGAPANDETRTYINRLKNLKSEVRVYTRETLDVFYTWYNRSEHARELTVVNLTKSYTIPTQPGYHKMYFYLYQDGVNGKKDYTVRQIVCVRGAGVCPNEADASRPVMSITAVTGITATSSTLGWKYVDKESHPQRDYQIQLSTVKDDFSDLTKMKTFSIDPDVVNASAIRDRIMTNLSPSTKYYLRMRAQEKSAQGYWSNWTDGKYSFTTNVNPNGETCACSGRSWVCKNSSNVVTSTTANSATCALSSTCLVNTSTSTATFSIAPVNPIGNITYTRSGGDPVTMAPAETYTYTTAKTAGRQSISVLLKDLSDNQTTTSTCFVDNPTVPTSGETCSCQAGTTNLVCTDTATGVVKSTTPTPSVCSVTTSTSTPDVKVTKTPSVVLNKGGSCTITWQLKDIPSDAACKLSGWGVKPSSPATISGNSFQKIDGLQTNQKYVIECSGPSMTTITKSVICRVNPDVIEN